MGWGEHGHSQGGRALPTEMYAGGPICGRGVLPGDEHKNLTDTLRSQPSALCFQHLLMARAQLVVAAKLGRQQLLLPVGVV